MTIKKYEIEIDEELLQGKVPVAFRKPTRGNFWITPGGDLCSCESLVPSNPRLILEEPYTPPSWLKPGWIYPVLYGSPEAIEWYWSSIKPSENNGAYFHEGPSVNLLHWFNFTPPTQRRPYKVG